jgi:hypothetical protein
MDQNMNFRRYPGRGFARGEHQGRDGDGLSRSPRLVIAGAVVVGNGKKAKNVVVSRGDGSVGGVVRMVDGVIESPLCRGNDVPFRGAFFQQPAWSNERNRRVWILDEGKMQCSSFIGGDLDK